MYDVGLVPRHAYRCQGKQFATYPVCFASKDEFTITEKERMQANKISTPMCGYKVTVFTPKRLYIFTSETEAELNNFDNTLRQMLHDVLGTYLHIDGGV
jgi:hypothetical protein